MITGLWLLMAVLVAALLWIHETGRAHLEWFVKPAAAATFIVTGVASGGLGTTFGRVLVLGLVLAALGDVLLIPKSKGAFLGGLCAFLLGHVAYAAAFVVRGVDVAWTTGATVVMVLAAVPVLRWLWPHVETKMRAPVAAYVVVITAMVALAAGAASSGGWTLLLGAFAFYLSDLSVARDRFVEKTFTNKAWGLPLYFFAQMVLASAAGTLGSP